jgi:hypothetical protein
MKKITLTEKYRANEAWENGAGDSGCPAPYPELLHAHDWSEENGFICSICGADGNA